MSKACPECDSENVSLKGVWYGPNDADIADAHCEDCGWTL